MEPGRKTRGGEQSVGTALDAMRHILQELRVANRAVEQQLGLSGAQLFVLEELAREPAPSLNALAARTGTRHSSVSTVVARLVDAGLVTRQAAPDDGRRVLLAVTARARRLLRDAPPSAQARLLASARTLPAAQLSQLADALDAWYAGFVRASGADSAPRGATARARALVLAGRGEETRPRRRARRGDAARDPDERDGHERGTPAGAGRRTTPRARGYEGGA